MSIISRSSLSTKVIGTRSRPKQAEGWPLTERHSCHHYHYHNNITNNIHNNKLTAKSISQGMPKYNDDDDEAEMVIMIMMTMR